MNLYIKSFESINESVPHNGIVLIKGKPKGKNKEQMLYAAHVISSAELRPGATMLFLSDTFYRVIQDGERLKGVQISWRSEDSLKDALNLKTPGKISLVRNNNKTPYHWKTLKETSISKALDAVKHDLLGSDYILESVEVEDSSLFSRLLSSAIDSIFGKSKDAVVMGWDSEDPHELIDEGDDTGTTEIDQTVAVNIVYVEPSIVEELKKLDIKPRQTIYFDVTTEISFSSWYDPGDYHNPPDGDTVINSISNEATNIYFSNIEEPTRFDYSRILAEFNSLVKTEDIDDVLHDRHVNFDKNF